MFRLEKITNFLRINDRIGTAGQPTIPQMVSIKDAGYQVVINLALKDSPNAEPDEEKVFTAYGINYIHIPVVWENPQKKDLDIFFDTMQTFRNQKVFIHCVLNMRVSAFLFLYRCHVLHEDPLTARVDLEKIWQPDGIWFDFIQENLMN